MWPIVNWHIFFHLLIDTCVVDWVAYYGLVLWCVVAAEQLVACCLLLIEWHLLPCMQFIWTSTYPLTRALSSSLVLTPVLCFFNLAPSPPLSLLLVLTPVLCFLNFAFSPSLSVLPKQTNKRNHHRRSLPVVLYMQIQIVPDLSSSPFKIGNFFLLLCFVSLSLCSYSCLPVSYFANLISSCSIPRS
jgi:hypothetical protein